MIKCSGDPDTLVTRQDLTKALPRCMQVWWQGAQSGAVIFRPHTEIRPCTCPVQQGLLDSSGLVKAL